MAKMVNIFNDLTADPCLNVACKVSATTWIHDHNSNFPDSDPQN
jgi:hypothetical protein